MPLWKVGGATHRHGRFRVGGLCSFIASISIFWKQWQCFLSLKRLKPKVKTHVCLVLDSKAILRCINRRGSRSPQINHVILAILSLARKKKGHLCAVHLEGVRNVTADALSRAKPLESEWSLGRQIILFRCKEGSGPSGGYVCHGEQSQTSKIHSSQCGSDGDRDRCSLHGLELVGSNLSFFPINLLLKVLHKLRSFKGTVARVAPDWPKSNWFSLMLELRLKKVSLPSPHLSQVVQRKSVFTLSWITDKV